LGLGGAGGGEQLIVLVATASLRFGVLHLRFAFVFCSGDSEVCGSQEDPGEAAGRQSLTGELLFVSGPAGHGGGADRGRGKGPQSARRRSCFNHSSAAAACQRATVVAQTRAEAKALSLHAGAAASITAQRQRCASGPRWWRRQGLRQRLPVCTQAQLLESQLSGNNMRQQGGGLRGKGSGVGHVLFLVGFESWNVSGTFAVAQLVIKLFIHFLN